jgi:hypothetical protein
MKLLIGFLFLFDAAFGAGAILSYGEDVAYLRKHTEVVELRQGDAAVAMVPAYQGRVMTSTASGNDGHSFGWLNYKLIESGVCPPEKAKGTLEEHIHVFGGEERLWLGPEGGQFGIFFPKGAAFDFASWKTPPPLDTEAFELVKKSPASAVFRKDFHVSNQSGTTFHVGVEREVHLLTPDKIRTLLGTAATGTIKVVAYETVNTLTNRGKEAWRQDSGLLSIWLLGMYKHSASTVVAIPVKKGEAKDLGPQVNDDYFGKVPKDRLKVVGDVVYFKADGAHRSKIGIPPRRSMGVAGSYSPESSSLTLTIYPHPAGESRYVNSAWALQENPYGGDAINSYNDGSPGPGKAPLGPFYELETSSPAAALKPGESITHRQTTIHITGDAAELDSIAKSHLKSTIAEITSAFQPRASA